MATAVTSEREALHRLVSEEADRLEAAGLGEVVVRAACLEGGFDIQLAIKTYRRDGVPWYVPVAQAALLELSIEEQLMRRTA